MTDRAALVSHRERSARLEDSTFHNVAADEVQERLRDVNKSFTKPLLIGHIPTILRSRFPVAPIIDDAERLDVEPGGHDLVIHMFGLHWSDDPVGQLVQSRLALQPDGLFIGVLFAGQSLSELRAVLAGTESSLYGGLSPRVAPMADVRALGDLLFRAGFALPVADTLRVEQPFQSLSALARELRKLGETNALLGRRRLATGRAFWQQAEEMYRREFPASGSEGAILGTFETVFLTGWAPAESQPKPLRPGSATTRLADALGVSELDAGESAKPNNR